MVKVQTFYLVQKETQSFTFFFRVIGKCVILLCYNRIMIGWRFVCGFAWFYSVGISCLN